jgi:hypothetical protein
LDVDAVDHVGTPVVVRTAKIVFAAFIDPSSKPSWQNEAAMFPSIGILSYVLSNQNVIRRCSAVPLKREG